MLSAPSTRSLTAVLSGNVSPQCPAAGYPCSAQPMSSLQSIPAVPKHQVALQCSMATYPSRAHLQSMQRATAEYPCSAQEQHSIPAVTNSNRRVILQHPTAEYPCSPQPHSILAVPMATYPCSAQAYSIFAVLNGKVSLSCPALAMPKPTAFALAVPNCNSLTVHLPGGGRETLHSLCAITALGRGFSK